MIASQCTNCTLLLSALPSSVPSTRVSLLPPLSSSALPRELQSINASQPSNSTLLLGMLGTTFHGASGRIAFGKETVNLRNSEDVSIGVYNIRARGGQGYDAALVSTYRTDSGWHDVNGTTIIYRDGTTVASEVFREVYNENFVSFAVRLVGLVLMSVAWALAVAALVMVHVLSKDTTVQQAQPTILKMLCVGSILTSTAIYTLSWDEGAGWSDSQLDVACALTPWFFVVGQLTTFCALFFKLWGVGATLQFNRSTVTVSRVIKAL